MDFSSEEGGRAKACAFGLSCYLPFRSGSQNTAFRDNKPKGRVLMGVYFSKKKVRGQTFPNFLPRSLCSTHTRQRRPGRPRRRAERARGDPHICFTLRREQDRALELVAGLYPPQKAV